MKDADGGVIPGVTVTATSPSLQVPSVVAITNEEGDYRLTPLPIGTYDLVFTLQGFQSFRREGLQLTAGFVARADAIMRIGALEESVTVSGQSPVVDVTSTAVATQFTRETLELAPTARNGLYSLLAQLPSVRNPRQDVGGLVTVNPTGIKKYGQLGEDWVTLEGVAAQSPKIDNWAGIYIDYSSMEEVRAEVVGGDASAPRKGLKMSIITKSGGNEFHGTLTTSYTSKTFQSTNLTDELRAVGITAGPSLVGRKDFSGDLGGRIIRDKLWFYGALRYTDNVDIPLGGTMPDGSPAETPHTLAMQTGKLSYQFTPNNKLVGFVNWVEKNDTTGPSQFVPWESRTVNPGKPYTRKVEWQGIRGNSLAMTAQYGDWGFDIPYESTAPDKPSTLDIRTMYRTGDNNSYGKVSHEYRHHVHGGATWFKPDLFLGNHEFKGGVDFMVAAVNAEQIHRSSGDYVLTFQNGVPYQIQTWNAPVKPLNLTHTTAAYVTDSWALSRRLTMNLGLRFSRDNGYLPPQCQEQGEFAIPACYDHIQLPIWNSLAPRIHAAYDLFGDAKTVVKGGWGRYKQMRGVDEIILANRTATTTTTWTWHDLNGNKLYETGEFNKDPNGSDFISIAGTTNLVPNTSEQQPTTDEFSVAIERELIPNLAVRAAGIYHRWFNIIRLRNNKRPYDSYNIPVTSRDPGPDGVANNADDPGTFITYWDYPASLRGSQFVETTYVNDDDATQNFRSMEFSITKRMSSNWQLMGTYSATKKHVPYITNAGGGNDYPVTTLDPNAEINAGDDTWDWQGGLSGAYVFPKGIMASLNYQHTSGRAFARTVLASGGVQIPTLVVRVEPIGSQRLPNVNLFDLRLEKSFRLPGGQKLNAQVNMFNSTNANTVINISDRSGPTYLRPTGILSPRIVMFGANYSF